MQKNKKYFLILILFISMINIAFARKITLKNKKTSDTNTSLFGGPYFEQELHIFQNSQNKNDKSNQYYGWETNKNIKSSGDPQAVKGGMFTMLGGSEYPTTFRSLGKDTRHQINGLMDQLQNEPLLGFDYESLEWQPVIATHWKIADDSLNYWQFSCTGESAF